MLAPGEMRDLGKLVVAAQMIERQVAPCLVLIIRCKFEALEIAVNFAVSGTA